MISIFELNPNKYVLTPEQQSNLVKLHKAINEVRTAWGKPMTVTSGVRSMQEHLAIYAKKGITDIKQIPMSSKHLIGQAVDIADPDGSLRDWCLKNLDLMQKQGLYFEDFRWTIGWVHFQCAAPGSGKRIFVPYADTKVHPMVNAKVWDGKYDEKYDKA